MAKTKYLFLFCFFCTAKRNKCVQEGRRIFLEALTNMAPDRPPMVRDGVVVACRRRWFFSILQLLRAIFAQGARVTPALVAVLARHFPRIVHKLDFAGYTDRCNDATLAAVAGAWRRAR